jgi:hypothetical protein
LVLLGVDFAQTHALERLQDLLPPSAASAFDAGTLTRLPPWSVAGRYPEDISSPSAETARHAVEAAQTVLDHVRAALAAR